MYRLWPPTGGLSAAYVGGRSGSDGGGEQRRGREGGYQASLDRKAAAPHSKLRRILARLVLGVLRVLRLHISRVRQSGEV